jgi:hypothetical protein
MHRPGVAGAVLFPTELSSFVQEPSERTKTMRRTIASKKRRDLFLAKAKELLIDLGADQEGDGYILQTKAGRLMLHPDDFDGEGVGTVFSRFDDPQTARQFVDCNRFSGKWNHHYFNGWTVETAIADLSAQLRRMLP